MKQEYDTDIVHITDFRLPGGTTHSVAEEVRAQSLAGYRTLLIHAPSGLVGKALGWSPSIREVLRLPNVSVASDRSQLRAKVVIFRHPSVVAQMSLMFENLSTDRVIMVANNAAIDGSGDYFYDAREVDLKLGSMFGIKPLWAPIGPVVRNGLMQQGADIDLCEKDWLNLLRMPKDLTKRIGFVGEIPVIGRHSRPQASKWPSSKEDILAAYPTSGEVQVEILGGADVAAGVLGKVPEAWNVIEFGGEEPGTFLQRVDFWVYFHHQNWVEAYGRAIMEALAAGAVVILPHYLRETYGDAAIYGTPEDVGMLVNEYYRDSGKFLDQSSRGQAFVALFHPRIHAQRLSAKGVEASGEGADKPVPILAASRGHKNRILFVTSNGAGMGHLTRLLAVANRLPDDAEPVFASMSTGVHIVEKYGIPYEYLASSGSLGMESGAWHAYFTERFSRLLRDVQPDTFVFDGTWPYRGLMDAVAEFPMRKIWMRRAMWKPETTTHPLGSADYFTQVIEPGELASAYDTGPTTFQRNATQVEPITLLSADQLLSREEARRELGYGPDERIALVTLGAGNINEVGNLQRTVSSWFASNAPGWRVVVTKPPISQSGSLHGIETLQVYPLSRYTKAFDVSVSAAGYNAFHEWTLGELPTLWIPNLQTMTDDQCARTSWAADSGYGLNVSDEKPESIAFGLSRLTDMGELSAIKRNLATIDKTNGAIRAAQLIVAGGKI